MKFFSTKIITLLSVTASLATPIIEKREDSKFFRISDDCKKEVKQYKECITDSHINLSNLESVCATFKSEKCQNFYKNGYSSGLQGCKNETEDSISFLNDVMDTSYILLKYRCTNDENGNICPLNKYELENVNVRTSDDYRQALKETCKSKVCTDAYSEYVNNALDKVDDIENKVKSKVGEELSKVKEKLDHLGNKIDDDFGDLENKIGNKVDNLENIIENKVDNIESKIESKIENILDKRDFNDKSQSLRRQKEYLLSVDCDNMELKYVKNNGTTNLNNSSSDAMTIKQSNIFIIATLFLIVIFF